MYKGPMDQAKGGGGRVRVGVGGLGESGGEKWKQLYLNNNNKKREKTMVHLHNGIIYSRKKERAPTLHDREWVELENIMLCEISQVVKDKYHMISPSTGT